jgi:hypothetical protein
MIRAAIYDAGGSPKLFIQSTVKQLNANIRNGGTWREMPDSVVLIEDALTPDDWPVHPDLVEPEAP